MAGSLLLSIASVATVVYAQNESSDPWTPMIYGDANRGIINYTYGNLPYRNSTEWPLRYTTFNWSDPAQDNGVWNLRWNTADNWLPGNLSAPGQEKIVVTSYALSWQGSETYGNLSAKINNDTETLRAAGIRQDPPNMCIGYMGHDSDFVDNVKGRMDINTNDPCLSLFGEECLASLRQAFTSAFDEATCRFSLGSIASDLPGCGNTWDRKVNGLSFLSGNIANGSQASNASYASPRNDDEVAMQVQLHAADDNSTYDRELLRTQFFVVKQSGKEARLLCTRFESGAWRAVPGAGLMLLTAGVVLSLLIDAL